MVAEVRRSGVDPFTCSGVSQKWLYRESPGKVEGSSSSTPIQPRFLDTAGRKEDASPASHGVVWGASNSWG